MNECIRREIKGFDAAIRFFSSPARIYFSREMVLKMASVMQAKYSQTWYSHYAQGFSDASKIIARTRK